MAEKWRRNFAESGEFHVTFGKNNPLLTENEAWQGRDGFINRMNLKESYCTIYVQFVTDYIFWVIRAVEIIKYVSGLQNRFPYGKKTPEFRQKIPSYWWKISSAA
jgi:hypothetical protein